MTRACDAARLAFLNTHLAAHAEKVEKRKEDIKAIIRDIHFGSYSKVEFVTQYTTFWLGDLNFRVDMPMEEANKAIDAVRAFWLGFAFRLQGFAFRWLAKRFQALAVVRTFSNTCGG